MSIQWENKRLFPLLPKSVAGATQRSFSLTLKRCGATRRSFAPTLKRCGVRDTVASVPATFLLLFSSPEKRRYYTQSKTLSLLQEVESVSTQLPINIKVFCFTFYKKVNGQPRTSVPTAIKQAFIFSHTKRALRARRGKPFHTPKSVAGLGTQPQVSQRLFCFFFLRLKKEDIPHSQRTAVPTLKSR